MMANGRPLHVFMIIGLLMGLVIQRSSLAAPEIVSRNRL
jgi:hypothetical protein